MYNIKQQLRNYWKKIIINPSLIAIFVFLLFSPLIVSLSLGYYSDLEFKKNLLAGAHGLLFEILIIGGLILWLNQIGERRITNQRYREEIDDFREKETDEAARRIQRAIKRLNENGESKINLTYCYLQGADLFEVNLQGTYLMGANLKKANLMSANLMSAYVFQADLEGAELLETNFQGADLREANLLGARNLTIEQLSQAKTLFKAKLDKSLLEKMRKSYPHLLMQR